MTVNETLPLCPDTHLTPGDAVLTEPLEVGPFTQAVVFIRAVDLDAGATIEAEVGISPTGYEDWEGNWTPVETCTLDAEEMSAVRISNFGNWLRLRFALEGTDGDEATVLAWVSGDG